MDKNFLHQFSIVLASQSPRRQQIIRDMGISFITRTNKEIDEVYPQTLESKDVASFLSNLKFDAYQKDLAENELLITADTIVCCKNRVLGKPKSRDEAIEMITHLSGTDHIVYTGITVGTKHKKITDCDSTIVHFSQLSHNEIEWYIDTYKPYDKAGSYGVQEWIGYVGIERINGSFYNVMGLPTHKLYNILKNFA